MIEAIIMHPTLRLIGENAFYLLVVLFVVLAILGLMFGKGPSPRSRPEPRAIVQERRLEQEEDTRDSGRI